MTLTILEKGNGYTIARDSEAHSSVPYGPANRPSGDRNHGFINLADRPELASEIPEARRSAGLIRLLEVVNGVGSRFQSVGCECGVFPMAQPQSGLDRYIGSYVAVVFRNTGANSAERIESLARSLVARVAVENTTHAISYEITVTPLRVLFGHSGCFELHVNAIGAGSSDEEAWAAFNTACRGLAHAFERVAELPTDDVLFR